MIWRFGDLMNFGYRLTANEKNSSIASLIPMICFYKKVITNDLIDFSVATLHRKDRVVM